ncbi:glycoside hydrolase family 127 protein [Lacticaseibacillus jixianensis]|uniref:Glycoside hydrolase family 127 protein n=1 Tax=Lacticaseibacillus jixianensis TaxID=2486012 RepID=A0ABW4B5Y7_9LACO|nr:beta-L-arabinofuranosidase domain-containing protein [Lacticaseibacillus jixianensis]
MQTAKSLPTIKKVTITSGFWQHYRDLVAKEVLPYQWQVMNDEADGAFDGETPSAGPSKNSHVIANLKIAAGQQTGHHYGFPFQDSDAYKWLEAAAYSLQAAPNAALEQITDGLVDLIAEAQAADGYLSTYFQIDAPAHKFKRLRDSHELYTMGHYIEAGVAYAEATGSQKALTIATRMADCIDAHFGPEAGKIHGYDGHPEIELALARLYEATGDQRYLKLAHYFLNQRGLDPLFLEKQFLADAPDQDAAKALRDFDPDYFVAGAPLKDQQVARGHAVRVVYLCTGMAHVARLTGDQELLAACDRFWNDIVHRQMYITGNVGQTNSGEAFTYDYDLPNATDYGETCAAVGMAFFARQMLALHAKGEYGDILEKELFNGALSGMALDGKHFFYVNPLEADPLASQQDPGKAHILTRRADWFGCACCPANLARLIASVDRYLYTRKGDAILAHQFIANTAEFSDGITITQTNQFPWSGAIHYHIANPHQVKFRFGIRIPAWSASYQLQLNGTATHLPQQDGFIYVNAGQPAIDLTLTLDMTPQLMQANNRVAADYGKLAVQREPIVYAAEQVDNQAPLALYRVAPHAKIAYHFDDALLGGVGVLTVTAAREQVAAADSPLYTAVHAEALHPAALTLIPYYAWANRAEGQMRVWFHRR